MRLIIIIVCAALLGACAKKQEAPREQFDEKKMFTDLLSEPIQLLAVKYQIPAATADKIAWDYYRKHDALFGNLLDIETDPKKEKKIKDFTELSEGIAQTISEIAIRYGEKETTVAAFIADLRLFERATQK